MEKFLLTLPMAGKQDQKKVQYFLYKCPGVLELNYENIIVHVFPKAPTAELQSDTTITTENTSFLIRKACGHGFGNRL